MKKKTLALLLGVILAFGLIIPVAAAPVTFSDVAADAWYASDVSDVQQYGIIEGVGNNKFLPNGNLTYAQAITMAARAYAYMNGETITGEVIDRWYDPYVEYALEAGLITEGDIPMNTNYFDKPCTREIMADLFYATIAKMDCVALNSVEVIPDVYDDAAGHAIYSLYRFGILTGNDKYGTFYPDRSITRAETAAILNRVLNVDKRHSFTLEKQKITAANALALALEEAIQVNEEFGAVVDRQSGEIIDTSENAYLVWFEVSDWYEGEYTDGYWAVIWVDKQTGEARQVLGLQDDYIPGMVDMKHGVATE